MNDDNDQDGLETEENWALEQFSEGVGSNECREILRSWLPRLRERANSDADAYREQIWDAVRILREIAQAISGSFWLDLIIGKQNHVTRYQLWAWPTDEQVVQWAYRGTSPAGLEDLDQALAAYLKRPWLQHNAIDVSAINALLVTELAVLIAPMLSWSFVLSGGKPLAQHGLALAGWVIGFLVRWVIPPGLAFGLLVHGHQLGAAMVIGLWGLYFLYRLVSIPARRRVRRFNRQATERIEAVAKAWHAARGTTINPSRLKELVIAAEERGATFQPVLHTLIDRAIQRDRTALGRS